MKPLTLVSCFILVFTLLVSLVVFVTVLFCSHLPCVSLVLLCLCSAHFLFHLCFICSYCAVLSSVLCVLYLRCMEFCSCCLERILPCVLVFRYLVFGLSPPPHVLTYHLCLCPQFIFPHHRHCKAAVLLQPPLHVCILVLTPVSLRPKT